MSNNFHKNYIKENDIIKEIISKYDNILNDKNIINEELNLVFKQKTKHYIVITHSSSLVPTPGYRKHWQTADWQTYRMCQKCVNSVQTQKNSLI